jgi:hypothetical protein
LRSSDSRLVVITDLPKLRNLQSLDINGRFEFESFDGVDAEYKIDDQNQSNVHFFDL